MLLLHLLRDRGPIDTAVAVELLPIHASLFQFHSCPQQADQPATTPAAIT
jgi:hypothetical protein